MIRSHRVHLHLPLLLALSWCAGACSESASHDTVQAASLEVPEDMARLLPSDAVLYLQASSVSALDALIAEFGRVVGEEAPLEWLSALAMFGIDRADLDADRPLGLALGLTPDGQPVPTLVLPVADPAVFVETLSFPSASRGGYVAVSMAPLNASPEGTNTLAENMPDSTLSLRIDLRKLLEPFRPMIDVQLDLVQAAMADTEDLAPGMGDLEEFFSLYMSGIRSTLDSADMFSLGVGREGDTLHMSFALDVLEGSVLAGFASDEPTGLGQLATCLRGDEPVVVMMGADMQDLMRRFEPLTRASMQMYPEPIREGMQEYMQSMNRLHALIGSALVYDLDVGEGGMFGMVFRGYFAPVDPEAFLATYESVLATDAFEAMGMSFSAPVRSAVDGVSVTNFVLEVDTSIMTQAMEVDAEKPYTEIDYTARDEMVRMLETMYGDGGVRMSVAQKDGRAVIVFGGDDTYLEESIARLGAGSGTLPAPLRTALEQIGDRNPSMVVHLDLGRFTAMMLGITANFMPDAEVPAVADLEGISAPLTMYGTVEGHTWRAGLVLDLAGLAELVQRLRR